MSDIVEKTEDFVTDLLSNQLDSKYLYHNLRHTQRVVKSTKELSNSHNLVDKDKEMLLLATWLHDTGYTRGTDEHEESSCEIAREFLTDQKYNTASTEEVCKLIMATKRHHDPSGLLEEIIRDADASHLGQESYHETSTYLREELGLLGIKDYSEKDWREANIDMFQKEHHYYTPYAQENWGPGKTKNLKKLL